MRKEFKTVEDAIYHALLKYELKKEYAWCPSEEGLEELVEKPGYLDLHI